MDFRGFCSAVYCQKPSQISYVKEQYFLVIEEGMKCPVEVVPGQIEHSLVREIRSYDPFALMTPDLWEYHTGLC